MCALPQLCPAPPWRPPTCGLTPRGRALCCPAHEDPAEPHNHTPLTPRALWLYPGLAGLPTFQSLPAAHLGDSSPPATPLGFLKALVAFCAHAPHTLSGSAAAESHPASASSSSSLSSSPSAASSGGVAPSVVLQARDALYTLHVEVLNVLLTLMSSQLAHPSGAPAVVDGSVGSPRVSATGVEAPSLAASSSSYGAFIDLVMHLGGDAAEECLAAGGQEGEGVRRGAAARSSVAGTVSTFASCLVEALLRHLTLRMPAPASHAAVWAGSAVAAPSFFEAASAASASSGGSVGTPSVASVVPPGGQGGVLSVTVEYAAALLSLPLQLYAALFPGPPLALPCSERATLLLCLLVHNRRSLACRVHNPFRDALCSTRSVVPGALLRL